MRAAADCDAVMSSLGRESFGLAALCCSGRCRRFYRMQIRPIFCTWLRMTLATAISVVSAARLKHLFLMLWPPVVSGSPSFTMPAAVAPHELRS